MLPEQAGVMSVIIMQYAETKLGAVITEASLADSASCPAQ